MYLVLLVPVLELDLKAHIYIIAYLYSASRQTISLFLLDRPSRLPRQGTTEYN